MITNPIQAFNRFMQAFRFPFRGSLTGLVKGPVQAAQLDGLSEETLQKLELYQHFGFTSGPPAGSQVVIIPIEGKTAHSIIVASEHGNYRLDVDSGESALYNQWGAKVHLKKEKIIDVECDELNFKVKDRVGIETRELAIAAETIMGLAEQGIALLAPSVNFGGAGSGPASAKIDGGLNTTQDVVAGNVSVQGHQHEEHGTGGGTTGPPV